MGDFKIGGSTLNDCKIGTTQVDKIYLGNELLWSKEVSEVITDYGYYYNHYAILDSRNIANTGWKVPSDEDWLVFVNYITNNQTIPRDTAANASKETSTNHWFTANGTNLNNFKALGAGSVYGGISSRKLWAFFHSSSSYAPELSSHGLVLGNSHGSSQLLWASGSSLPVQDRFGFPCRLLKINTTLTSGQTGTYTGNDGNIYPTICIGSQEFTQENLRELKYRDGSYIEKITNMTDWGNATSGAWCAYDNNNNIL